MVSKTTGEQIWSMVNEQGMTVEEVAEIRGVARKTIVDYLSKYQRIIEKEYIEEVVENDHPVNPKQIDTRSELEKEYSELELEHERLIKEYSKEMKSKQKMQDQLRIIRKERREGARVENAVEGLSRELVEINKKYGNQLSKIKLPSHKELQDGDRIGVVQLSDLHANEIIDLPHNKYDFNILSKRLKKFADAAIDTFTKQGITKVLIAATGDGLNSDRRLDELLNQATNRSKAVILLQNLLTQFILDLRQHFKLHIVSTPGNESRVGKDWGSSDNVCSDNYDFVVWASIKQKFEFASIEDITFGDIDKQEVVVDINGQNWLFTHDCSRITDNQVKTQSKIGAYYLRGVYIDYIVAGHIHCTRITDFSARSSSIAGSNEYNETKLNLISRAAQNLYSVGKDDRIASAIDLQDVSGIKGYDIIEELEAYNTKSHDKLREGQAILKIII